MNLRKNGGFIGLDVSAAVIILLVAIPIITGMIYNITSLNNDTKRKSQAINIAVNSLEIAKGIDIDKLNIKKLSEEIIKSYDEYINEEEQTDEKDVIILRMDDITYKLKIDVVDYKEKNRKDPENVEYNKVKTVSVDVIYKLGDKKKDIYLNTVVTE